MAMALTATFIAQTDIASAQSTYPSRAIRAVVPYPPGGGVDALGRILSQRLADVLHQPVIVDNRGGASGIIGSDIVAKSTPDGHTLLVIHIAFAINPASFRKLPYDTLRDFAQVALVATTTNVLLVNPKVPAKSVKDLITLAKSKPGQLNYAAGGSTHLAAEYFKMMTGTNITHVSYKGTGPALADVLSGQIEMMMAAGPGALPFIKSGRLSPLAVTALKRWTRLPDIPTLNEEGVPGYEFDTWYGVHVPAKTPRNIIMKLNSEIMRALAQPEIRQRMSGAGLEPVENNSPEEFTRFIQTEIMKISKIVKASGIQPQ